MFYDEQSTIELCEEDPSKIFLLIDEGHKELVDKIITTKKVSINTTDQEGNNIPMYLLNKGWYEEVKKYMKIRIWDVNHQNIHGETFAHLLVTKKYLEVMDIIKQLIKNKRFLPNIVNKKGETILDKSINNNYIYTTVKILEDERFDNIDLVSFKNLYEKYIKNNNYGAMSKVNNLEVIFDNLKEKTLMPKVARLINQISKNYKEIKNKILNNEIKDLDKMIYGMLENSL